MYNKNALMVKRPEMKDDMDRNTYTPAWVLDHPIMTELLSITLAYMKGWQSTLKIGWKCCGSCEVKHLVLFQASEIQTPRPHRVSAEARIYVCLT